MAELIGQYREAWQSAGHPGRGRVMLAFHMFCHSDGSTATQIAREPLNSYLGALAEAAAGWVQGASSRDYQNYGQVITVISKETFETQVAKGAAWVGAPAQLREQVREYQEIVGGMEIASLQMNFNTIGLKDAEASMRLFAAEVMPEFLD